MAKKNNQVSTEIKRSPGRPSKFDGPTIAFLVKVPAATRQAIRDIAAAKGETLAQVVARLANAELSRVQSAAKRKKKKAAPAPAADTAPAEATTEAA